MTISVVHLSARDRIGGAARATYRIHRSLRDISIRSSIVVQRQSTDDTEVCGLDGVAGVIYDGSRRKLDQLPLLRYRSRDPELFSPAWLPDQVAKRVNRKDADVTHLHWVAGGFLQPSTIRNLPQPLVWTLHDMWPFTGGCHYAKSCERYTESCGSCPHLGSETNRDLSRAIFEKKRNAWADVDIRIITPSTWLSEQARQSSLFEDYTVETIPNPIDTTRFRPRKSTDVRRQLGLSDEKLLIGTGADRATDRKGLDLFFHAATELAVPQGEAEIVLFGRTEAVEQPEYEYDTTVTGFIDDDTLCQLFSELDVLVVPSRQEAFGQTASEALASGTPVVAFDSTGPADIVAHESTGYLADSFDSTDLARGIDWVLADADRHRCLGEQARAEAVSRFDSQVIARQYERIYEDVLG